MKSSENKDLVINEAGSRTPPRYILDSLRHVELVEDKWVNTIREVVIFGGYKQF